MRTVLFKLMLMAAASVIALLLGELVFRAFVDVDPRFYNTASTQHIVRPDTDNAEMNPFDLPVAMRITRPGVRGYNVGSVAVINKHGMRDEREYPFKKATDVRRVMFVGDSVMFGHTEQAELIPAMVGKHLTEMTSQKVETPAFSCPGWALNTELLVVKQAVSKFEVDDLVVLFILNDLTGREMWVDKRGDPDHEMQLGRYDREERGAAVWVRKLVRRSSLLTALAWTFKGVYARRQPMDTSLEVLADDAKIEKTVSALESAFAWLANHCKARGIRCTLAVAPYAVQFSEDIGRKVVQQWYGRPYDKAVMRNAAQTAIMSRCKAAGLRCLDLFDGFGAVDNVEELYFKTPEGRFDYVHLSAKGNDLAGRLIASHLAKLPEAASKTGE